MTREEYHYWLANIPGFGPARIGQLLQVFHSPEDLYHADRESLEQLAGLKEEELERLLKSRDENKLREAYQKLRDKGIRFITREDPEYPGRLKEIYGAPFALYVKGNLPADHRRTLAVIGARNCSAYGMELAKYLSEALARAGIEIISGLARGIDACAHMGALQAGGVSYGVLGCGIDICYPRENIQLYMELQKEGGVLSEYPPGTKPLACHFPMRNRIISGLSDGILVIEARKKSGTLITVDMGLEQGKNIYALPGRITDQLSAGCNNLIKMGAKPVTSPEDILEDFQIYSPIKQEGEALPPSLEPEELVIYQALDREPKHLEDIMGTTGLPINRLTEHLLSLEMRGAIRQVMRNYYVASCHSIDT
jgi:DNA processing protein